MGKFKEVFDTFGDALELPDNFRSAVQSAYDEDFSSANAKVEELETAISEKDSATEKMRTDYEGQLSAAKAANYDLLRSLPNDNGDNVSDKNQNQSNNDDSPITIDSLFSKRKIKI